MNTPSLQQLPGSPGCVICDNNGSNPRSLHLAIFWNETEKAIHIPCAPDATWCGYSGVVHGGLVTSVMDEAMAWAVKQVTGDWAFTVDCHMRFKAALVPGKTYTTIASVEKASPRKISAIARVLDENGAIAAQAEAIFLPSKGRARTGQESV